MKDQTGILDSPYLGYITDLYSYLTETYPSLTVYFSQYLETPSCCIEADGFKYEWHVGINAMSNVEVWLYNNRETKDKQQGQGYGEKLVDIIKQAEKFMQMCGFKKPQKQMTLFDFMEEE